jgi:hypothetical protein
MEWIEAINTSLANISVLPENSTSVQRAYAHQIAFIHPWDIVVANSDRVAINAN